MDIPEREFDRRNDSATDPLRTPVIIGCAFAMDKEFFYEIGAFDQGMDIIGTENIEISVRVSQSITLLNPGECHLFTFISNRCRRGSAVVR